MRGERKFKKSSRKNWLVDLEHKDMLGRQTKALGVEMGADVRVFLP